MYQNPAKIIRDCLDSVESLSLHAEFTNPESINDPFCKRIFEAIMDLYFEGIEVNFEQLFLKLPIETRREDIQKCMEISL